MIIDELEDTLDDAINNGYGNTNTKPYINCKNTEFDFYINLENIAKCKKKHRNKLKKTKEWLSGTKSLLKLVDYKISGYI